MKRTKTNRENPLGIRRATRLAAASALLLPLGLCPRVAEACWMTQEIPLVAGWNAIHVKVNPLDYGCSAVFGGGGIDQVTWWNRDRRDDGTGTVSADTFAWYAGAVEPSTFGAVLGDGRYLVHAVAATNLVLVGTPAIPSGKIYLGESNLVGLSIPSGGSVSCSDFFAGFASLADNPFQSVGAASNLPVRQNPGALVKDPSQAFWLETTGSGETTWTGPLAVSVDTSDKILSWSGSTAARTITVKNVSGTDRVARFDLEKSLAPPAGQGALAGPVALKRETIDWSQGYARRVYEPIAFPFTTNLAAGASFALKVRPDLDAMKSADGAYLGILAVSDAGSIVSGEASATGTCLVRVGLKADGGLATAKSPAGLWVGSVALTGVNRARMLTSAKQEWDAEAIQDTTQAFSFRLILHAADDGTVTLLKQAFVASETAGDETPAILADRAAAKEFRRLHPNATIRRVSSANFPFMEPRAFDGALGFLKDGATLSVSFTQAYDAKDNPFVHAFHPSHDNLAFNNGKPSKKGDGADGTGDYESWSVTRRVSLTFAGADPLGANDDWNKTVCGGTYRETITGLNKTPIIVEGAFRLNKTLDTPEIR